MTGVTGDSYASDLARIRQAIKAERKVFTTHVVSCEEPRDNIIGYTKPLLSSMRMGLLKCVALVTAVDIVNMAIKLLKNIQH